jgi:hypothetical protein
MLNPTIQIEPQAPRVESRWFSPPNTDAADKHVQSVLAQRALTKFKYHSLMELLWDAKDALKAAGHWRDEVQIDVVQIEGGNTQGRCSRLLHGIPSPRFWRVSHCSAMMPAIDIVYFFVADAEERKKLLTSVTPIPSDRETLSQWLAGFTSRTFQPDLIAALCDYFEYEIQRAPPPLSEWFRDRVIGVAAEIDRYAWYRGYRTMNLAKAAPVWAGEVALAKNRLTKQTSLKDSQ